MSRIIGFSGAKQSGKTTSTNFLYGYQLRVNDVIEKFMMNQDTGELLVNTITINEKGEEEEGLGILDIERRDPEFVEYAAQEIWPYVRSFSFADPLKIIAIQLFGLSEEQCFGTDEDKNSLTDIRIQDMSRLISGPDQTELVKISEAEAHLTAREFLQYFGTDICRRLKSDIWVRSCVNRIKQSGTELAIVPDIRFPNEVKAIRKAGGKVIRLTRKPHEDSHDSETALDGFKKFDHVIDNQNMTIDETNRALLEIIKEWGWITPKA
tara:strand:- start:32344 stop:33141 length:798 start_codon:yes stop_codon:yes gene_type:complete